MVRMSLWVAYRYTSTPGVTRGAISNRLGGVSVETEPSGICGWINFVRDQRSSRLLHQKTTVEGPVVLERTTGY